VGGTSRAALKRAATLGDGWHGIYRTPEEVAAAIAIMDRHGREDGFRISLRAKMRIGEVADDTGAGSVMHGSPADIAERVRRYSDAGVDQLVLEPGATELDDFMDQMTRFTAEVAARFPSA
jgi:alkanesulfonate monooxygenase SsuD/methylene tetrahydromethanopterin reductase-like flavin-dependent oxidoreductase (luciferase family)